MAMIQRIWRVPYSAAVLSASTALLLTVLFWPFMQRFPFMFFWPAIIISVWQNSTRGGLLATILIALIMCFVIHPFFVPDPPDAYDYAGLAVFVLLAGFMSWFVERKKKQEDALRENDQRFRMMINSVPGGVWAAKADGSIEQANQYWYELNNLNPENAQGVKWSSMLNADDLTHTSNSWLKAVEVGKPYELLARSRNTNGKSRWLFNRVVPVRDSHGHITDWYGTSMDVTDLKETQEALTRERELLEKLIDNVPAMIVMYRKDTSILKLNRAFEHLTGWTNEAAQGVSLMEELYPDADYRANVRAAMLALQPGWRDVQMKTRDGRVLQSSWANIRLMDDTQVSIGIDITARKRIEQRTAALQQITAELSRALTPAEVASVISREGFKALGTDGGGLMLLTDNNTMLELVHLEGYPEGNPSKVFKFPLDSSVPVAVSLRKGEPFWFRTASEYMTEFPFDEEAKTIHHFEGRAAVPLVVNNQAVGAIWLAFKAPQTFDDEERGFIITLAHQSAQAIERAKLYEAERVAHTRAELRATRLTHLQHLTNQLSNAITRTEAAQIVADRSFKLVNAEQGHIWEFTEDGLGMRLLGQYAAGGKKLNSPDYMAWDQLLPGTDIFRYGEEVWRTFNDYAALYPQYAQQVRAISRAQSWSVLPLLESQGITGMIIWSFDDPRTFDDEEKDFLRAIAKQCAQAFERARLYEQAKAMAAEEERRRLARDLHDSVSQTLFAATVMAESLPKTWKRDPDKAFPLLEQMHTLNRAASAEMRVLLSELRPEVLEKTSLETLYNQLVDAIKGRGSVQISLDIHDERTDVLPPTVHVALYRIAQETLNNIMKHAQANQVTLSFVALPDHVELHITDDGKGFDPAQLSAGIGMGSMRERAENIDAAFTVNSSPGQGTQVTVRWPRSQT